jgi:3-oxoacyl-[acyl-carrier-protein] synthase II
MNDTDEIVITAFGAVTPIGGHYETIRAALFGGISGIKENRKFNCDEYIIKHAGIPDEGNEAIKWPAVKKDSIGELFYAELAANRLREHPLFPKDFYSDDQLGCVVGVDEPPLDLELCIKMFSSNEKNMTILNRLLENIKLSNYNNYDVSAVLNSIYKKIPFSNYAKCHVGLCSASLQSIGMGYNAIRSGRIQAAIVGGVSGKVNPINAARLELIGATSLDTQLNPTQRSRPFDKRRSGFVLAEGGVLFLLEKKSNVLKRKESPLLKILGYGSSLAAQHIVAPHTESLEMSLSMERALQDSGIAPQKIELINAHATSTILNDLHESRAINRVFGDHTKDIKVVANKSLHGHMIAAAGAMEVLNTLISVNENFIPGTINLDNHDEECIVNVIKQTENAKISIVLKNSFGMGGLAASMVLGRA